jgi:hypothetical protein
MCAAGERKAVSRRIVKVTFSSEGASSSLALY